MKNRLVLLLFLALSINLIPARSRADTAVETVAATSIEMVAPEFDRLVVRLRECRGPIPALTQWLKVLKPALYDLGYTEDQIKQIKTALTKNTATIADARYFSQRWHAKHHEQIDPEAIFKFLRSGRPGSGSSTPASATKGIIVAGSQTSRGKERV